MSFKIKNYEIEITVKTGLYIGAGDSGMRIGGIDNSFIRNPRTNEPYIPGSSIKGKMRSLLEYDAGILTIRENRFQQMKKDNNPDGTKKDNKTKEQNYLNLSDIKFVEDDKKEHVKNILKLFGVMANNNDSNTNEIGITRLSVSDFNLFKDENDPFAEVFEIKPETAIDRLTGTAMNGSLRFTERVVAGTKFKGNISLKIMDKDNEQELEELLLKGLKYIELDALGGSSSRGYGRVEIKFLDEALNERLETILSDKE